MRVGNLLASLCLLAGAAPLPAQVDRSEPRADSLASRVLEHTFTTPSREFVRVRLQSGELYRVEIAGPETEKLDVHPVGPGVRAPRVRRVGERTGNLSTYEIRTRATAEYEIRVLVPVDQAVRLIIDRKSVQP